MAGPGRTALASHGSWAGGPAQAAQLSTPFCNQLCSGGRATSSNAAATPRARSASAGNVELVAA
eukprot:10514295-Alexandrium_andersonii.AAC.1